MSDDLKILDTRKDDLSQSIVPALRSDPDEMARYQRLSKATGLDPYLISEDAEVRATAEAESRRSAIDFDLLVKTRPSTSQFLSVPENADVAHDDVDGLSEVESASKGFFDWFGAAAASVAGAVNPFMSEEAQKRAAQTVADAGPATVAAVRSIPSGAPLLASGILSAMSMPAIINRELFKDTPLGSAYGTAAALMGVQAENAKKISDAIQGDISKLGPIGKAVAGGMQSIGMMLPTLPFGGALTLGAIGTATGGLTAKEALDKGASPLQATLAGVVDGLIEAVTEKISLGPLEDILFQRDLRQSALKALTKYIASDVAGEQLATVLQDANAQLLIPNDKTWKDYWAERPEAAFQTLIATLSAGGAVYGLSRVLRAYDANFGDTKKALDLYRAMVDKTGNSKLLSRMPEKMKEFITKVRDDSGGAPDIYIEAAKFGEYFTSVGMDPSRAAEELGVGNFADALATGGDLVIPIQNFTTLIAASEHRAPLEQHIRFRPQDMSIAEVAQANKEREAQVAEIQAQLKAQKDAFAEDPELRQIYQEFYDTQIEAGEPPSAADARAILVASRYAARAAQLEGSSPLDLWREDAPISVVRESERDEPGAPENVPPGETTNSTDRATPDPRAAETGSDIAAEPAGAPPRPARVPLSPVDRRPPYVAADVGGIADDGMIPQEVLDAAPTIADGILLDAPGIDDSDSDVPQEVLDAAPSIASGIVLDTTEGVGTPPRETRVPRISDSMLPPDRTAISKEEAYMLLFAAGRVSEQQTGDDTGNITLSQSAQVRLQRMRNQKDVSKSEAAFIEAAGQFIDDYDRSVGNSNVPLETVAAAFLATVDERIPKIDFDAVVARIDRMPRQAQELYKSGNLGKFIEVTENQRRQDILDYIRFFRENSSLYTPVEAAAIIALLSRQTIIYDAGKKAIVRASFSATSFSLPSPMNAAIAARAVEQMRAGVPVAKAIAVGVEEWATTKSPYPRNGWVRFEQSNKPEDIDTLMQACASNTGAWCTASSNGHATEQLTNGDFYVYFREGVASIAIRMYGPDVLEVSGGMPGQHLKPEDYPLLEEHAKRNPSLRGLRAVILDAKRYRTGLESIKAGVISPALLAAEVRRSTEDGSTFLDVLSPRYHRLHSRHNITPLFSEAEREALDALRRPTLEEFLQAEEVDSVTVSYSLSAAPLFPNLHTVYTDVDGSIENFPVLRRARSILYKGTFEQDEVHVPLEWVEVIEFSGVGGTAIHFDNLEVLEDSIQGASQTILKFPKLRVAPRLQVVRQNIENFPMLEEAQYVEIDERVVPPNLRKVKRLLLGARLDGVFTLPNLESVKELVVLDVERVSMPALTDLEKITNDSSTDTVVHVPKLKTIEYPSDEVILDAESLEELRSYNSEGSKTPIENLPSLWKVGYLEAARPIPQIREARTVRVYEGGSLPNLETARDLVVERGEYPVNLRQVSYLTLGSAGTADMRNLTTPPIAIDVSATIVVNAPEGEIEDVRVKSGASVSTKGTIKYATLGRDCKIEAVGIEHLTVKGGNCVANAEIAEIAIYDLPANLTTTSERIKTVSQDPEVTEATISGPKTFDYIYKLTGTLTLPDAETVGTILVPNKLDAPKLTAVNTAYFDARSGSLPPAITELDKLFADKAEVHHIKKVRSARSSGSVLVDLEEIVADEERATLIDTVAPKLRKIRSGDFRKSKVPVLDQVDHIFSLATEFPALKTAKSVETTKSPIPNKFPVLESISNHLISESDNDEFPALWTAGSVNSEATLPALRFVAGHAVLDAPAPVLERVGENLVAANRSFVPDNVVVGGVFTVGGKRFNQSARTRLLTVSEKIKNLTDGLGAGDLFAARAFLESVPGFVDRMDRGDGTKTIEELAKEYLDYDVYEKLSTPSYATTVKNIEKAPHAVIEEYYAGNLPNFLENLRDSRDEQFTDIVDDVQSLVGPVEAAAILSRLVTDSYVYDRANRRVRTSPLKSSYTSPTSLPKKAVLRTAELIRSGVPANKAIATALQEDVESASYPDGWNTFKRSKDTADAENLTRLAATSRGEWCTGQNVQFARSQLTAGDFHIYVKDGEAQVAIRMAGDKIAELAGSAPGQLLVEDDRELFKNAPVEVSEEAIANQMAGNRQLRNLAVEFAREGTLPEEHSTYFMRKDGVLRRSVSADMLPDTMDKKSPFYARLQELHSTEVDPDTIDEIPYLIALEGATISEKILQKTKTLEAYKGVRVEGSVENIPTVYGWMSDANTFGFNRSSFMPSSWRLESLREDRTLNQSARTRLVDLRTMKSKATVNATRALIEANTELFDEEDRGAKRSVAEMTKEILSEEGILPIPPTPSVGETVAHLDKVPAEVLDAYYGGYMRKLFTRIQSSRFLIMSEARYQIKRATRGQPQRIAGAAIVARLTTTLYEYDATKKKVVTAPLSKSYKPPTILPENVLRDAVTRILEGESASSAIKNALEQFITSGKTYPDGWVTFNQSKDLGDVGELMKLAATSRGRWCTGTNVLAAKGQLGAGDFHVYVRGGEALLAVRMAGPIVAEIAGSGVNQSISGADVEILKSAPVEVPDVLIRRKLAGEEEAIDFGDLWLTKFGKTGEVDPRHTFVFLAPDGKFYRTLDAPSIDEESPAFERLREMERVPVELPRGEKMRSLYVMEGATITQEAVDAAETLEVSTTGPTYSAVKFLPSVSGGVPIGAERIESLLTENLVSDTLIAVGGLNAYPVYNNSTTDAPNLKVIGSVLFGLSLDGDKLPSLETIGNYGNPTLNGAYKSLLRVGSRRFSEPWRQVEVVDPSTLLREVYAKWFPEVPFKGDPLVNGQPHNSEGIRQIGERLTRNLKSRTLNQSARTRLVDLRAETDAQLANATRALIEASPERFDEEDRGTKRTTAAVAKELLNSKGPLEPSPPPSVADTSANIDKVPELLQDAYYGGYLRASLAGILQTRKNLLSFLQRTITYSGKKSAKTIAYAAVLSRLATTLYEYNAGTRSVMTAPLAKSYKPITVLPKEVLDAAVGYILSGASASNAIKKALAEFVEAGRASADGWVTFKRSKDPGDAKRLMALAATSPGRWCTGSSYEIAKNQLSRGDFHIYVKGGLAHIAIRQEGSRIGEISGSGEDQALLPGDGEFFKKPPVRVPERMLKKRADNPANNPEIAALVRFGRTGQIEPEHTAVFLAPDGSLRRTLRSSLLKTAGAASYDPESPVIARLADLESEKIPPETLGKISDMYVMAGATITPEVAAIAETLHVPISGNVYSSVDYLRSVVGGIPIGVKRIGMLTSTSLVSDSIEAIGNFETAKYSINTNAPNLRAIGVAYQASALKGDKLPKLEIIGTIGFEFGLRGEYKSLERVGTAMYNPRISYEAQMSSPETLVEEVRQKWFPEIERNGINDPFVVRQKELLSSKDEWRIESNFKERTLQQGAKPDAPRAQITLGKGVRQITLFDGADLSSILHELGHTWLEEMRVDALRENASEQLKEDWATLAEALGISEAEEIPTDAHEQFARWSERYLLEGNSPSAALRGVFLKFKHWLLRVYRTADELGAEIPEKVREVFDRLLATKEEIDAARADHAPMFNTPEQAGLTQAEWDAYRKLTIKERALGEELLHRRILGDLRREDERWWKAAEKQARADATAKVRAMPVYRALRELATNKDVETGEPTFPLKLSRQALIDRYGEGILKKLSPASLRTAGWIYQQDGIEPWNIALIYGFDSGDALIQAILDAPPERDKIEEMVRADMLAQFGDPTTHAALSNAAFEAIANDARDAMLEMELKILRKRKREMAPFFRIRDREEAAERKRARELQDAPVPKAILTSLATQEVGAQRVRDVSPQAYLKAAERAGRGALKAATAGKYDQAADLKQQQIVNMYMYKAAVKAKATAEKDVRYMKQVAKRRKNIGKAGPEWLAAVDTILSRLSFIPRVQNQLAQDLSAFAEMVKQQTGEDLPISPALLREAGREHYTELSLDELHGIANSVRAIELFARELNKVRVGEEKASIEETVRQLVETGRKNIPNTRPLPETAVSMGILATGAKHVRDFWNTLLRPEKLFERLDGGTSGIWHTVFWDRFAEAEHVKLDLMGEITAPLMEYQRARGSSFDHRLNEMVYIKSLGKSIQRRTAIGIALNSGNNSNLSKMMNGGMWFGEDHYTLTSDMIAEILDTLSKDDWNLVELLWKSVDKLFPHLDALNRKVVGLPLERIPASPINTRFGTVSGGYWPAVADPLHNTLGEIQESPSTHKMFPTFSPSAATKHSFREERTAAVYPLNLDWASVFTRHVDWATTDIAYHEAARDASNLLRKPAIRKLIQNRFGESAHRALQEWVVHQTNPQSPKDAAGSVVAGTSRWAMSNVAVMALGYKVALAGANAITAPIQSFHQLSPLWWARGVLKVMSAPNTAIEAMSAMSGEMRHHTENMYAAVKDTIDEVQGTFTLRAAIVRNSMAIHRVVEKWTSATIWYGKYMQETARGVPHEKAIKLADKTVRTTQMSGAAKDLSAFERSPVLKVYTQFLGPLIVLQNEMRNAVAMPNGGLGFGPKSLLSPKVFMTYMTTMVVPAVLFELISGRGPDDDDDESIAEWAAVRALLAPLQMVPMVRDAGAVIESVLAGEPARYSKSNPVADIISRVVTLPKKVSKESATTGDWVDASMTAIGIGFGLPTGQAGTTLQFAADVLDGRYEPEGIQDLRYLLIKRDRRED